MALAFGGSPDAAIATSALQLGERYEHRGEIGRGGIGLVVRARDRFLERDIAIKLLLDRHAGDPATARRFLEEAQVIAQLQHPGIVPVHDVGLLPGGQPFFAMRLIEGGPWSAHAANAPGDRAAQLDVFLRVCEAVAFAHSRGVTHRDLKPANVMIGSFGEVLVVDWGMAKVRQFADASGSIATLRTGEEGSHSVPGSVMGTPGYMAPEQARGECDLVDARCDVFGLGAILCELLSGFPPCPHGDAEQKRRQAAQGDFAEANARLRACGAEDALVELALDCLQADPASRPDSAAELVARMLRFRSAQQALAEASRLAAARAPAERKARRLRRALVVVLLAGTLIALWLERERGRHRARADLAALNMLAALEPLRQAAQTSNAGAEWQTARVAARQAGQAIAASGASATLVQRASETCASIEGEADASLAAATQRERDEALVRRFTAIRAGMARDWNSAAAARAYQAALADAGLESSANEASLIRRIRSSAIAPQIVEAIDDLAAMRRNACGNDDPEAAAWRAVAEAVDPDRDRVRFRAVAPDDVDALLAMAGDVDVRSTSPHAVLLLASRLQHAGQGDRAHDLLLGAQVRHPEDFWLAVELAWCCKRTSPPDLDGAIHWFTVCTALQSDSGPAHANLAAMLCEAGRMQRGIAVLRRAAELDGTHASTHLSLAHALHATGDDAEALAACRAALACGGNDAEAMGRIAWLQKQAGRTAEAAETYQAALARDPDDVALLLGYGAMLCDQVGDLDGAEQQFRRCCAVAPSCVQALLNLARVAGLRDRPGEQRTWFERVLELDPEQADAHLGLAALDLQEGRGAAAEVHARRVLARHPDRPQVVARLADALRMQGMRAAAAVQYVVLIRHAASDGEARAALGDVLASMAREAWEEGDLPSAIAVARQHADVDPAEATLGRLAAALYDEGRYQDALAVLSAHAAPCDGDLAALRGEVLFELGLFEEARVAFAAAGSSERVVEQVRLRLDELTAIARLLERHPEPWASPLADSPADNLLLARLCVALRRPAEALRFWTAGLEPAGADRTDFARAASAAVQAALLDPEASARPLELARGWLQRALQSLQVDAPVPELAGAARRDAFALQYGEGLAALRTSPLGDGWQDFWSAVAALCAQPVAR